MAENEMEEKRDLSEKIAKRYRHLRRHALPTERLYSRLGTEKVYPRAAKEVFTLKNTRNKKNVDVSPERIASFWRGVAKRQRMMMKMSGVSTFPAKISYVRIETNRAGETGVKIGFSGGGSAVDFGNSLSLFYDIRKSTPKPDRLQWLMRLLKEKGWKAIEGQNIPDELKAKLKEIARAEGIPYDVPAQKEKEAKQSADMMQAALNAANNVAENISAHADNFYSHPAKEPVKAYQKEREELREKYPVPRTPEQKKEYNRIRREQSKKSAQAWLEALSADDKQKYQEFVDKNPKTSLWLKESLVQLEAIFPHEIIMNTLESGDIKNLSALKEKMKKLQTFHSIVKAGKNTSFIVDIGRIFKLPEDHPERQVYQAILDMPLEQQEALFQNLIGDSQKAKALKQHLRTLYGNGDFSQLKTTILDLANKDVSNVQNVVALKKDAIEAAFKADPKTPAQEDLLTVLNNKFHVPSFDKLTKKAIDGISPYAFDEETARAIQEASGQTFKLKSFNKEHEKIRNGTQNDGAGVKTASPAQILAEKGQTIDAMATLRSFWQSAYTIENPEKAKNFEKEMAEILARDDNDPAKQFWKAIMESGIEKAKNLGREGKELFRQLLKTNDTAGLKKLLDNARVKFASGVEKIIPDAVKTEKSDGKKETKEDKTPQQPPLEEKREAPVAGTAAALQQRQQDVDADYLKMARQRFEKVRPPKESDKLRHAFKASGGR